MNLGRVALQKLLLSAERAHVRGGASRDVLFSRAALPDYFKQMSHAALQDIHGELKAAERDKAIRIQWDLRAGEQGQVKRIALVDKDALARFLGVTPHWSALENAKTALAPWVVRLQVAELLKNWSQGKTPRGRGPGDVGRFVIALKVLDQITQLGPAGPAGSDKGLRRFSAEVLGDSKAIEEFSVELDLLTSDEDGPPRDPAAVFGSLGLFKHPQPFMVAGRGRLILEGGSTVNLLQPYIGLAPQTVCAIDDAPGYILSVENLDIFNELANGLAGNIEGILLYTAGMPSPSWIKAYRAIASSLPDAPIYHWGDTDLGGVRILRCLDDVVTSIGRRARPWMMGESGNSAYKELPAADIAYVARIARSRGWEAIAEHFRMHHGAIEQQAQRLKLPG